MSGAPFADGSRARRHRSSDLHMLAAWAIAAVPLVWALTWMAVGTVLRGGK